jgi:hypothetical protein
LGTAGKRQLENTPKWVDSQGKNFFGILTLLVDLRLKCCIGGRNLKNAVAEELPKNSL